MAADGAEDVAMTPVDPYEPPQATDLSMQALSPDYGRRGAAWFGLTALAGLLVLLWFTYDEGFRDLADFLQFAGTLGLVVVLCAIVGYAIGRRCLDGGWLLFCLRSAVFGGVWAVGSAAIIMASITASSDLRQLDSFFDEVSKGIPPLAAVMVPLTLVLAIGLRAWSQRHR